MIAQYHASDGGQREQQWKHGNEGVVGQQRHEVTGLVVAELFNHRNREPDHGVPLLPVIETTSDSFHWIHRLAFRGVYQGVGGEYPHDQDAPTTPTRASSWRFPIDLVASLLADNPEPEGEERWPPSLRSARITPGSSGSIKAPNGEIIAASQGYESTANAEKGIEAIKTHAPSAKVEDHS